MTKFTGRDANVAISRYFGKHGGTLPELSFDALAEAIADPDGLKAIITAIESLYAARADLNEEGRELLFDLAEFAVELNFYGYQASGRGPAIVAVAERMKDGRTSPVKDGDPEIEERFVPKEEDEEEIVAAPEPSPENASR